MYNPTMYKILQAVCVWPITSCCAFDLDTNHKDKPSTLRDDLTIYYCHYVTSFNWTSLVIYF